MPAFPALDPDTTKVTLHASQSGHEAAASRDLQQELEALAGRRPLKLIIDTDIGSDFDDVMALLMVLNLPPEAWSTALLHN